MSLAKPHTRRRPAQLALAFRRPGRGGARPGAGRKPGPRPVVLHRRRPDLRPVHPVHVTLRVVAGLPDLRRGAWLPGYERAFAAERDKKGFRLCHYSIQDTHFHLVCEADDRVCLWRGIQRLCVRLARMINRNTARTGRVFADRYHRVTLTNPTQVRNALAYALLNWAKYQRGRGVRLLCADRFTSARSFDGWRRPIRMAATRDGPAPVARPRSWLLRIGWRRARSGLIDPAEVPGST